MRNLIYAINLTLDGCCDHTKFQPDEETLDYFSQLLKLVETFLYGRLTYQLMVPYWPNVLKNPSGQSKADYEYALAFMGVDKSIVCSQSLDKVEGKNTRIMKTNLKEEILKLKQEPGKDILTGGLNIPSQLAKLGLIDEYRVVIHPLLVGEGSRLFQHTLLKKKLPLDLVESRVFKSGVVALRYQKR